jgi:hypothetical protein
MKAWMKLVLIAMAALAVAGCGTTTLSPDAVLKRQNVGESVIYAQAIRVDPAKEDKGVVAACNGSDGGKFWIGSPASARADWMARVCSRIENPRVRLLHVNYYNHPWTGYEKFNGVLVEPDLDVNPGDIVQLVFSMNDQGLQTAMIRLTRVAAKASAPRSDCYWAGSSMTAAFGSQGVICDGWDYRQQKFAK